MNRQTRGVVAVVPDAGRLLVIRRSQWVRAPRTYCFPGGQIEPGEDELAALAREMDEELGVGVIARKRLWESTTPWGVHLAWWCCELTSFELRINAAEVESTHWLVPHEIEAIPALLESNRRFFAAWREGAFELALDPTGD
jgi:8-oxo-dGTP diphosphatase